MALRNLLLSGLVASAASFAPAAPSVRHATTLGVAVDTSDIKNGLTVELDGEPYKVLNFSIMKQARGAAKTTIKFKNLKRGNTIENTYRSGEKFETAQIDKKPSQFTYSDEVRLFHPACRRVPPTSMERRNRGNDQTEEERSGVTERTEECGGSGFLGKNDGETLTKRAGSNPSRIYVPLRVPPPIVGQLLLHGQRDLRGGHGREQHDRGPEEVDFR